MGAGVLGRWQPRHAEKKLNYWEAMMDWQLGDVRARLGISQPPLYEPIPLTGESPPFIDALRAAFSRTPGGTLAA